MIRQLIGGVIILGVSFSVGRSLYDASQVEAQGALKASEASLTDMTRARDALDRQYALLLKDTAAKAAENEALRERITNAKNSSACVHSAPVRALLGGLRGRGQSPDRVGPQSQHRQNLASGDHGN